MFADVAVNAPLRAGDRVFTFGIPQALQSRIAIGTPVRVPFGARSVVGFVVRLPEQAARRVRPILGLEDHIPPLPPDLVALAWWMADHYVSSVGEAVASMVPPLGAAARSHPPPAIVTAEASGDDHADQAGIAVLFESNAQAAVAVVGGDARFEAYAAALRWAVRGDRGAIVLVPEVVQAQRMIAWVARHTGRPVALLSGSVPAPERWEVWREIQSGRVSLVVGTRLAVFAPVPNLGLILVDQEDDASYKEEREPRYHARTVAQQRAVLARSAVVLGSPTPSLEVVRAVEEGQVARIALGPPARPAVALADVRAEAGPLGGLFGRRLYQALARVLPRGRAIIFVPRRGYADFLLCHECGTVPRCASCGVALTYHGDRRSRSPGGVLLRCHLCGRTEPVPEVCTVCQGTHLRPHGVGTERVEQALRRLFSGASILRLDSDVAPDEAAQQRIWQQFARRGGVLVGTQLLVRGVGRESAPVVGVIGVDAGLYLPDFRAGERMLQILTRLSELAGEEMIVQTFSPTHPALVALAKGDHAGFYRDELAARQRFGYPPYRPLINLVAAAPQSDAAQGLAQRLAQQLASEADVLGPSPAPLSKIRGRYRWQVLIKERAGNGVRGTLSALLMSLKRPAGVRLTVDVDPVDLL
jgi:primosomal protein N' (replication factor Y) (superfamily II helicase)